MAKNDKTWQRVMRKPIRVDITFSEIENFLLSRGLTKKWRKATMRNSATLNCKVIYLSLAAEK